MIEWPFIVQTTDLISKEQPCLLAKNVSDSYCTGSSYSTVDFADLVLTARFTLNFTSGRYIKFYKFCPVRILSAHFGC